MFEAFGAIHSAGEQPGDVAVMTGSTMKQRDVLVDREGRRDRRSELNQLHVLLCPRVAEVSQVEFQSPFLPSSTSAKSKNRSEKRSTRRVQRCVGDARW